MSVFETVDDIVAQIREADQPMQGNWYGEHGDPIAYINDVDGPEYLFIRPLLGDDWEDHPAAHEFDFYPGEDQPASALAPWVLEDGALEAVLAAEVDPEYARAAHRAGVSDAWQLIEAWRNGIPVEFLSALGGEA